MHQKRTLCLFSALVAITSALPARADSPEKETHQRYREVLERYSKDLTAAEGRYKSEIVGKVYESPGVLYPEERILATLKGDQKKVADTLTQIDGVRDKWTARTISLEEFFRQAGFALEYGAKAAFEAQVDETSWRVSRLSGDFARPAREASDEFDKKADAIRRGDHGYSAEADAKVEALRKDYEARERILITSTLATYSATTQAIVARRRVLAGDLWRLVDFHERRGMNEDAKRIRELIYGIHCYALGETLGNASDSSLDFFVRFPGSYDRLILRKWFVVDVETLHKMDPAFKAEPVESLRQYDNTLPALTFTGSEGEQIAQLLSARLMRFYTVQSAQEALFIRLKELNAQAAGLPDVTIDLTALNAAIDQYLATASGESDATERRAAAEKALNEAEDALRTAEIALDRVRSNVYVKTDGTVVPRGTKGSSSTTDAIAGCRKRIKAWQQVIDDPGTSDHQRQVLRTSTIPGLEAQIRRFEAAVTAAGAQEAQDAEKAKARRDAAQTALNALPAKTASQAAAAWDKVTAAYETARAALPGEFSKDLKDLARTGSDVAAGEARKASAAVGARVTELQNRRATLKRSMREAFGELGRAESELALLAKSVATLRMSAAVEAERMLVDLGTKEEDEVVKEIKRLKEGLGEAKDLLEKADGRLEKLEKLRNKMSGDDRGAWVIESVQERLGTISKTLEFLGDATEKGLIVKQAMDDLKDARTSLKALSTLLDAAGSAGGAIPVIGPTFGRFLGFYAQAAGACCEAACNIQDRLVRENLEKEFGHPAAERHLYTQGEVDANSSLFNDDARQRIARMLQVRRLLFLSKASNHGEASNMTR